MTLSFKDIRLQFLVLSEIVICIQFSWLAPHKINLLTSTKWRILIKVSQEVWNDESELWKAKHKNGNISSRNK